MTSYYGVVIVSVFQVNGCIMYILTSYIGSGTAKMINIEPSFVTGNVSSQSETSLVAGFAAMWRATLPHTSELLFV